MRFPSPALAFPEFRAYVRQVVERLQIDLIVPASEEIFHLAQIVEDLAPATLFAPSFSQLRRLHSKWEILAMAQDCEVRSPATWRATSQAALHAGLDAIPGGVLKPEFSREAYHARFAPHTGLDALDVSPSTPWLIQEKLSGKEISTFSVVRNGRLVAHASYEPRWRVAQGASLYFHPVVSPAAERFVAQFAAKHELTGQLSFDLMQEVDGTLALIECNPRTTSGVHLFDNGIGLGRAFFDDDAGLPQASISAKAAKLAVALLHGLQVLKAGQFRTLREDLRAARDSSFLLRDPLPLLSLYAGSLEIFLRCRGWQVPASQAYTFDLEWNG
jgi:hypothetical protein